MIEYNEKEKIEKHIDKHLDGWGIYYIDYIEDDKEIGDCVIIDVEGDWKHAHKHCDHLMEQLNYACEYEETTAENGSDWYSSTHYYIKD